MCARGVQISTEKLKPPPKRPIWGNASEGQFVILGSSRDCYFSLESWFVLTFGGGLGYNIGSILIFSRGFDCGGFAWCGFWNVENENGDIL